MIKKILYRVILITTIGLMLSIALSLVAFNYISNYYSKEELKQHSVFVQEKIQKIDNMEELNEFLKSQNPKSVCITIFASDYTIIAENNWDNIINVDFAQEKYIQKALEGEANFKIGTPYKSGDSMIMYTARIDNVLLENNDFLVVRYSSNIFYNNRPFWFLIAFSTFVWIFIAFISVVTIEKSLTVVTNPLLSIQHSLEDIKRGQFEKPQLPKNVHEAEFAHIFDSINEIAGQISDNISDLKSEQQKSNFLLQSINQGVIAVSKNSKIILTNNAVLSIFKQESNIVGESLSYLIKDKEILDKIKDAVSTKSYFMGNLVVDSNIYRVETINIKEGWANFIGAISMLVVMTDITQENKSATIRAEFFANASHELKTPLTAIRGYSDLLLMTKDAQKVDKCANEINNNSIKMLNLIDDMLRLSKLDAQLDTEDISKINVGDLCRQICSEQEVFASSKGIELICEGDNVLFGRINMITMLVSNLVNNAIKYNKPNGTVHVSNYIAEDKLVVSIKDTGIGISPKQQGRIFERFYMIDSARNKDLNNSTGLGLAIVKHIAVIHGAEIEVNSKVEEGTTINVLFPLPKQ